MYLNNRVTSDDLDVTRGQNVKKSFFLRITEMKIVVQSHHKIKI